MFLVPEPAQSERRCTDEKGDTGSDYPNPGNPLCGSQLLHGVSFLETAKNLLNQWCLIVAAWAVLVGSVNLTQIHGRKVSAKREGWFYSAWLMFLSTE